MEAKIFMAKGYAHKGLTKMKLREYDDYDLAFAKERTDHPALGECLVGAWVCGVGAFNVHFPIAQCRPVTDEEREDIIKNKAFKAPWGIFKLKDEEFARDLSEISTVVDWQDRA